MISRQLAKNENLYSDLLQTLDSQQRIISRQLAEHVNLYSDLLQALDFEQRSFDIWAVGKADKSLF